MEEDDEVLRTVRAKARRDVHAAFGLVTFIALAMALVAHHDPAALGLQLHDGDAVANGMLFTGAAYVLIMFAWDRIFWERT